MRKGNDLEIGSAMLKARIIDFGKARGMRVREFPALSRLPRTRPGTARSTSSSRDSSAAGSG